MKRIGFVVLGIPALLLSLPLSWGQTVAAQSNRLITGKLIYVGPMPHGLRSWIIQDFKDWGKYRPTLEKEGVDLVMEARWPRRRVEFEMRAGRPVPKRERLPKNKRIKHLLATMTIRDWVTGARLWRADLLDEKAKKQASDASPGPETRIRIRGMSSAQIAETVVRRLRAYTVQLERQNPTATPIPHRP